MRGRRDSFPGLQPRLASRLDFLLHHRCLLLANAGEALLDQAREFFLAGELNLRVFLGHAEGAVASDL